jgi:hypothetical protein
MNNCCDGNAPIVDGCQVSRIRELNDQLRTTGIGGRIFITRGVAERGRGFLQRAIAELKAFSAFDEANDPHREHDFGGFEIGGETVLFKIDYYDLTLTYRADDPADPDRCFRVLTLMMAEDY